MKKRLCQSWLAVLLLALLVLSSCSVEMMDYQSESVDELATPALQTEYDVAFITDGSPLDSDFNTAICQAITEYGTAHQVATQCLVPADGSSGSIRAAMEEMIVLGSDVIVCYGSGSEVAVYELQNVFPEVNFVLLQGQPHAADFSDYSCGENVCMLTFAEQEVGFLAGVAAVRAGYTSLGFIGGMAVEDQIAYGLGFLQGVDYACRNATTFIERIQVQYHYSGAMSDSEAVKLTAGSWYTNGVQCIFSTGGVEGSVLEAADRAGAALIGLDLQRDQESVDEPSQDEQPQDSSEPDTADTVDSTDSADTVDDADSVQPTLDEDGKISIGQPVQGVDVSDATASSEDADAADSTNSETTPQSNPSQNSDTQENSSGDESSGSNDQNSDTQTGSTTPSAVIIPVHSFAATAIKYVLEHDYANDFPGGSLRLGIALGCVGFDTNALPSGLTLAEYLELCTKIGSGEISINRIVNANYDIEAQLSTKIELTVVQ